MTCDEVQTMLKGNPSKEDWILLDAHIDACQACDARLQADYERPLKPSLVAVLAKADEMRLMCPSLDELRGEPNPEIDGHLRGCKRCRGEHERLLRGESVPKRRSRTSSEP